MSKARKKRAKVPTVTLRASTARNTSARGLYAAKLLFEFRVVTAGVADKMRLCEERIVLVKAASALKALTQAERQARAARMDYRNRDGSKVLFRFVGVLDLLRLDFECEPNEVWYDLVHRLRPMERRHQILPKRRDLNAVRWERNARSDR